MQKSLPLYKVKTISELALASFKIIAFRRIFGFLCLFLSTLSCKEIIPDTIIMYKIIKYSIHEEAVA